MSLYFASTDFFHLFICFKALLTLYVWQQHVCTAARRSRDFAWDREGDSCGESQIINQTKFRVIKICT